MLVRGGGVEAEALAGGQGFGFGIGSSMPGISRRLGVRDSGNPLEEQPWESKSKSEDCPRVRGIGMKALGGDRQNVGVPPGIFLGGWRPRGPPFIQFPHGACA